jgi:dCTP deaminase
MILSAASILDAIKDGDIIITPFIQSQLGPNTYDLTLNPKLYIYKEAILDHKKQNPVQELVIPEAGLVLRPGELYIGSTNEYTESHNLVPMLEGKSSLGRLGLSAHVCAGVGDIGFKGNWTLEITVTKPLRVYPNIKICQILFFEVSGEINQVYTGKYQGQTVAIPSRSFKDYE